MTSQTKSSIDSFKKLFKKHEEQALKDYFKFLSFESISTDPQYGSHVKDCVNWLADYLRKIGMKVELWPTSGYPVLFASDMRAGPDKPTLMLYNHYDVQPVDPIELWSSPPFEPTIRNGEVYARGAQDNKGQCFYTIQALKLMLERDQGFPINIKLCIEGEEESGSAGLASILKGKKSELAADYLAIVDLGIPERYTPAVTMGVRGMITMDVDVQGSHGDLHSGCHGGIVYNPLHALVEILHALRDPNGKIAVPGFYDDVLTVSKEERDQLSLDFDEKKYEKMFGAKPTGGEKNYTPLERNWLRPNLEINGITGGYGGVGFKTVIPARANAKISCRLVPNQDPKKIGQLVARFIESKAPPGIQVKVNVHNGGGTAVRASISSKVVQAFAKSYSEVFNKPCKYIFEGASIPVVSELAKASGAEVVLVGMALPDDQIHAPNEHFGVDRLLDGATVIMRAIELLS